MGLAVPTDILPCSNQVFINATRELQPENHTLCCINEARTLLARNNKLKGSIHFKLRKKNNEPYPKICQKPLIATNVPASTNTVVSSCYSYLQDYNYPIMMNTWHPLPPLLSVPSPVPVPVVIPTTSPIFTTHISPIVSTIVPPMLSPILSPILPPILPQTYLQEDVVLISNFTNEYNYSSEQIEEVTEIAEVSEVAELSAVAEALYYIQDEVAGETDTTFLVTDTDPIELYLKLPKHLFPTANMHALDPNPIIDEFCKWSDLQPNIPWILDLEFGIPKTLIRRPIPTYNVKLNSINCKNAPDAIHPGFESCNPDFKKALLFYYDCIVSAWYKGYMIMYCDTSVENFQSWLLLPMQVLGMCWP